MTVQVPIRSIHLNSVHWPQPNQFNPERANLPGSAAFLSFGAGTRNCIGRVLAITEARAVISSMLLKYRLELVDEEKDDLELETGLRKTHCHWALIHPAKDIRVKLIPLGGN